MMKAALILALIALPAAVDAKTPAPAAQTSALTVGAAVIGKDNQNAGTVAEINDQSVVIDTGTHKVPVPRTAVGSNPKGNWIGMTRAELDTAFDQAIAQARTSFLARLTPGTTVQGLNGAMLGTVKQVDAQNVTITTDKGDARAPLSGFGPGPNGSVVVGLTKEQLDAAMSAAPATPQR